eukprot:945114-Karenia_brevis.AAC.1
MVATTAEVDSGGFRCSLLRSSSTEQPRSGKCSNARPGKVHVPVPDVRHHRTGFRHTHWSRPKPAKLQQTSRSKNSKFSVGSL